MSPDDQAKLNIAQQLLQDELTIKGLRKRTREAYLLYFLQVAKYFDRCPNNLSQNELKTYFSMLARDYSWSTVKVARNAIQFYYKHVLERPWQWVNIIKPPKDIKLQDVLTRHEVQLIINQTHKLSFQTYFLVIYSMGLRLSEGLQIPIADIDSRMMRLHIRNAKGGKDRFVPLPQFTLQAMRRYWSTHRDPVWLFPRTSPARGRSVPPTMDAGGPQVALKKAARECGIIKHVHMHTFRHSFATHLFEQGVNLHMIRDILGHAHVNTTAKYMHATSTVVQNQQEVVNSLLKGFAVEWVTS